MPSDIPGAPDSSGGEQNQSAPSDLATVVARLADLDETEDNDAAASPEESDQSDEQTLSEEGESAAADESAEGEDDGASEEDEDAAPAEEAETEGESESKEDLAHGNMRVGLRDGTVTTVGELRKLADEAREYRAKIPELTAAAEKAREFEARDTQREQAFQAVVPVAFRLLHSRIPPAPDPSLLDESNPNFDEVRYFREKELHTIALNELQQFQAGVLEYQKQQQQQIEEARRGEFQKFVEENRRALQEKLPELADPVKGKAVYKQLIDTVSKYDYTEQEIDQAYQSYDYRMLYMMHDLAKKAAAYDKIMAQKPVSEAKAKAAVPVQKPGRVARSGEVERKTVNDSYNKWRSGDRSMEGVLKILEKLPS